VDETKAASIGLGDPCNKSDQELFAMTTVVMDGNGERLIFFTSPFLNGLSLRLRLDVCIGRLGIALGVISMS
jgi:hypothetical protein